MQPRLVYSDILSQCLTRVQEKNPSFSLRAFAKKLETSPASLSQILKGKRALTVENGTLWLSKIKLIDSEKKKFIKALNDDQDLRKNPTERQFNKLKTKLKYLKLSSDHFKLISNWYHYGLLNVLKLDSVKHDPNWLANKLGISLKDCQSAIKRLTRLNLLEKIDGKYKRVDKLLETSTDVPSKALRHFHQQNIKKAFNSLNTDPVHERDITSIMMPVDLDKLVEAKKKIQIFRKEMAEFLKGEKSHQVYSLNIQLFPQTKTEERK
jgi:uncharacterized protein (TIGR02147 family)